MAPKKKDPRRIFRDPREDRSGKYPPGFNRFGSPIWCGMSTPYGPCPEPSYVGTKCKRHLEIEYGKSLGSDPRPKKKAVPKNLPKRKKAKPAIIKIDPKLNDELTQPNPYWHLR